MTGTVYIVEAVGAGRVKIGWTGGSILRRLPELQVCSPFPLRLLAAMSGSRLDERRFHCHFSEHRVIGEWFDYAPAIRGLVALVQAEAAS